MPTVSHGVQAGLIDAARAIVWARCSEPGARLIVEWDTSERFAQPRRVGGAVVALDGDQTGTVELAGLPGGQTIVYRVRFEREAERGAGDWVVGKLATPRADGFRVAWTGDTCGQGYGRNVEWGGLRGFAAVRAAEPQLFINSGDLVYADNPIEAERVTLDGRVWKNVTNERVARVAQSLDDFRARFAYNLEDENVRALAADVGAIVQWDDHETRNNWWPGEQLDDKRYDRERDASKLAALARRAMFEWCPLAPGAPIHRVVRYGPLLDVFVLDCRTFRAPNDAGTNTAMLGAEQAKWLVDALTKSTARWKVVASDQPISLLIGDAQRIEGFANGAGGPPVGREVELAALLAGVRGVRNIVWITADVHYAAAHHFDPVRANGLPFDPFWEFIAGPIHAGTFGPEVLDTTLGAEVKFQWVPPAGTGNLAPWDGLQSFGTLDVARDALTVALWGIDGKQRYRVELPFTAA